MLKGPFYFLRGMFNTPFSDLRHPTQVTYMDGETGKIIGHYTKEELNEMRCPKCHQVDISRRPNKSQV